ncbi:MAG: hypothetical protein A3C85_02630 [Candidatus Doudnabacteria bacterium RIFCSPHIGHO2_02_FULL_48_21]|nr:MAG: hypothetical protein A3K05_03910 [Candidatus Doudnabacteria bacterium RIFCSPHIGHO2_01_48_18]OGE78724.1 MAG: hypothetical protein A2668_04140 [Candidatus Doudnabacteria bacterium RIFCSPHIGHO2_01_FULL_48_180]OGE91406.1 MAG: hypothetical protein A3F44_00610 [Candidatus Doudnabacteria bacterium RIFCSPHIGHO2_12_FULL_47_25]OGE93899.1 MAG: hypothetical protein A3C85_02630 [Candidatus Doudnabacteria bacterium RIFCSPHIGHO2_02_FULL_48_21]OGF01709.1 MAG: hypothetical protein A3G07_01275 [Candidatu
MLNIQNEIAPGRKAGRKTGFFLAATIFFTILNTMSHYFSGGYGRGLGLSGFAVLIFFIVFLINRRHKKWVW